MNFTVRYDQSTCEYSARNAEGRVIGSVYFLKEHGGGKWKWSVTGTANVGFCDTREEALLKLQGTLNKHFEEQVAA